MTDLAKPQTAAAPSDWTLPLQAGERLLWSGCPDPTALLIQAVLFVLFSLAISPGFLVLLLVPAAVFVIYGSDTYALTNQRILRTSQPLGRSVRLQGLPRAGTHLMPSWNRGMRALTFTAADGATIRFHLLSRADFTLLLQSYPQGGPQPALESAT